MEKAQGWFLGTENEANEVRDVLVQLPCLAGRCPRPLRGSAWHGTPLKEPLLHEVVLHQQSLLWQNLFFQLALKTSLSWNPDSTQVRQDGHVFALLYRQGLVLQHLAHVPTARKYV